MKNKAWKVSNFTLWIILGVSLIIALLFYCGGEVPEAQRIVYDLPQPSFTDLFIGWVFVLLALAFISIIFLEIYKYAVSDEKSSVLHTVSFTGACGLLFLLFLTWIVGDGDTLNVPGYVGSYNNSFWLKVGDMWLYSISILIVIAVGLIVCFSLRNYFNGKK
ncbi:MAG: hypothetical protein GX416_01665 [Bacteroidales bacterium]|nr:hypothetical protein [Bacteroidales bacterium]